MKKIFYIYIVFPLLIVYSKVIVLLWGDLNYFLIQKFESIYCPDIFTVYTSDLFWTFLYFSFFILILRILLPEIVKKLIECIQYYENKSRLLTRVVIIFLQFLFIWVFLFIYYYFALPHDCIDLKIPGKCACINCAMNSVTNLYTWLIFYLFIAESLYNWSRQFLPDFIFKFDFKFIMMAICAILSLLLRLTLNDVWDFRIGLNFNFAEVLGTIFIFPFMYIIACGYNIFLLNLEKRKKIVNIVLFLAFAMFPFISPFFLCILEYFLHKNIINDEKSS